MSTIVQPELRARIGELPEELPPLEAGDRLDQPTFHARYEAMPPGTRAELIGGVVYMPSPLKVRHGRSSPVLGRWLSEYEDATPGTELLTQATSILGEESEPQPDATLIISRGGQTRVSAEDYLVGAPEWLAEIASST